VNEYWRNWEYNFNGAIYTFTDWLIDVSAAPLAKPSAAAVTTEDPTKYNVPEYYQHNELSYYDVEMSLTKYRLPQPNKYDPLKPKKWFYELEQEWYVLVL